jgi:hypothetical protein
MATQSISNLLYRAVSAPPVPISTSLNPSLSAPSTLPPLALPFPRETLCMRSPKSRRLRRNRPSHACKLISSHAVFDVVGSLLGFAIIINSSILILAAAVFYNSTEGGVSDLFDAYELIKQYLGQGPFGFFL